MLSYLYIQIQCVYIFTEIIHLIKLNLPLPINNTDICTLRLLQTFAGVLGEKIHMRTILKENIANYISLESFINVDFGKKYKLPDSLILQKKIANNRENDHVSFN